jgi:hypothetical protein
LRDFSIGSQLLNPQRASQVAFGAMTTFLAILTGGGLAALGGLLSGLVTNWLGDRRDKRRYAHERAMAMEARRHDEATAAEARRQQRLEQAYLELLAYLAHHAAWARSVRSLFDIKPPDPLKDENVKRIEGLVEAYGSDEVRRLMVEWIRCGGRFANTEAIIQMAERSPNSSEQLDDKAREELEALAHLRNAMLEADNAIRNRVRLELAGEV